MKLFWLNPLSQFRNIQCIWEAQTLWTTVFLKLGIFLSFANAKSRSTLSFFTLPFSLSVAVWLYGPCKAFASLTMRAHSVSPSPNPEDQAYIFMAPGDRVAQLYPQALGTHVSHLLWLAWVTVVLFLFPATTQQSPLYLGLWIHTTYYRALVYIRLCLMLKDFCWHVEPMLRSHGHQNLPADLAKVSKTWVDLSMFPWCKNPSSKYLTVYWFKFFFQARKKTLYCYWAHVIVDLVLYPSGKCW
jgi:hypothetical protein